jgi:hypothetical protein
VRATGQIRLEDDPGYFVQVDGVDYALQGGWFLSQPEWEAI